MKTPQEIVQRLKEHKTTFGWEEEVLLPMLPFELAKAFLIPDAPRADWDKFPPIDTPELVVEEMKSYMMFAWEKVKSHRGISAGRSLAKMMAWLWVLGDEELYAFAENPDHYAPYAAPVMAKICKKYGFPIPGNPSIGRMMEGLPCVEDCEEGCRS